MVFTSSCSIRAATDWETPLVDATTCPPHFIPTFYDTFSQFSSHDTFSSHHSCIRSNLSLRLPIYGDRSCIGEGVFWLLAFLSFKLSLGVKE